MDDLSLHTNDFWKWGGMELIDQGIGKILQMVIEIAKNLSKNEEGWF